MLAVVRILISLLPTPLHSRASLQAENRALRHQLSVVQQSASRPRLHPSDRILWAWLSQLWKGWRDALVIVRPSTVITWQRRRFRDDWRRVSRPGRPKISSEVRDLIRRISSANPLWGSPKIVRELAKLGIDVAPSTVDRYRVRPPRGGVPNWRSFLRNYVPDLVSVDFFTVPTIKFRVLFVFLVLATDRRRVLHFNVTEHPSSEWTARQLIQALPWETPFRYLLRDRDKIYCARFRKTVENLGLKQVLTAVRSPWQNPYVERLIGSIRRECLDHTIVFGEDHLRRVLGEYFRYYHRWRVHQSLEDSPDGRPVQPPEVGDVIRIREVGGLHHHYERRAA